jgi:hypothetical protein
MNIQLRKLGAVLIVAVLTAAGCGGSSGGGDSVSPPPPTTPPPPPSGGIIRSGVAVGAGPITGFGSIIVNGITYNTDAASFTRDDNPSSQEDFKVGETVIVKGTISDDNSNAVAETVELDEIVEGPVSSINADGSITVLGQIVTIGLNASVDDSCPASLDDASIAAVEVFGNVDGTGVIDATRIECKTALEVDEYEINGTVSGLDTTNFRFSINGLQVNYANAVIDNNFPGGTTNISEDDPVEVKGLPANFDDSGATPVLGASKVDYRGGVLSGSEGDHYEVEGFITDFSSATQFNLKVGTLTIAVTTTDSTVYEGGSAADLGNNLKLEVEGDINSSDVLQATKIEIKSSTNVRVVGLVDAVSTANSTITILGITVNTSTLSTRFEDKTDARIEPFGIGDVAIDNFIEARGQELPEGQITAFLVERDDPDPDTELRGFTEPGSVVTDSAAAGYRESFQVLGVTIDMGSVEIYRDTNDLPILADEFWSVIEIEAAGGNGYLVDIKGAEQQDGTTLTAREVELEME